MLRARSADGAREYFDTGFSFGRLALYRVPGTMATLGQMQELLKLYKAGHRTAEIAARLQISRASVKAWLNAMRRSGDVPPIKCRCGLDRSHSGVCSSLLTGVSVAALGRLHGIGRLTLQGRLKNGWSLEAALTTPVRTRKRTV